MRTRQILGVLTVAVVLAGATALPAVAGPRATLIGVDEMRRGSARPGGVANCSNDDPSAYTGVYAETGWTVAGPEAAHLNAASVPGSVTGALSVMQVAFDAWLVDAAVPRVTVAADGAATRARANRLNDLLFGRTGGSIATTYTWGWSDGLVESDVVFNKGLQWFVSSAEGDGCVETAGTAYDVGNIATHEFGHVYGLDHPAKSRYETMYAYGYTGETLKRSPATGDVAGMTALYG